MPNLENQRLLHFEFQCQKLFRLYRNTYILLFCITFSTKLYRGLWFNRTHFPLFQNMSVKIYTNFFLSSGGYNFKINYLKDKMRDKCEFISCWTICRDPRCNTSITYGTKGQNAMKKQQNLILRYLSLKFSCDQIIKTIGLIL